MIHIATHLVVLIVVLLVGATSSKSLAIGLSLAPSFQIG